MFLISVWTVLLTVIGYGDTGHFDKIPIPQFCDCWNVNITRTGNDLHVDISFNKLCWESPMENPGGFQVIPYESTMVFRIGIYKSYSKMLDFKDLPCQINKGCFTTISMVRDTSLEVIPFCRMCDICKGKKTDYIRYTIDRKKTKKLEVVTKKPIRTPVQESNKPRFLVVAGVVTIVATIATAIITTCVYRTYKTKIQHKGREHTLLDGWSDSTDRQASIDV